MSRPFSVPRPSAPASRVVRRGARQLLEAGEGRRGPLRRGLDPRARGPRATSRAVGRPARRSLWRWGAQRMVWSALPAAGQGVPPLAVSTTRAGLPYAPQRVEAARTDQLLWLHNLRMCLELRRQPWHSGAGLLGPTGDRREPHRSWSLSATERGPLRHPLVLGRHDAATGRSSRGARACCWPKLKGRYTT